MKVQNIIQLLIIYILHQLSYQIEIGAARQIKNLAIESTDIPLEPWNESTTAFPIKMTSSNPTNCNIELNFSNMELHRIGQNFISSPNVKNLTLQGNEITVIKSGAFDSLPNLEYLDLSRNRMSYDHLLDFNGHPNLKVLILDYNCESGNCLLDDHQYNYESYRYYSNRDRMLHIPDTFPKLQFLSLRNININSFIFGILNVNYLDISENYFGANLHIFDEIPKTLESLVMEHVGLTTMVTKGFRNLKFLNINYNNFPTVSSNYCFEKTLCLQNLPNLRYLSMSNCKITKIEDDAFKGVENLLELDISKNEFTYISDNIFEYIPFLEKLDLSNSNILSMPNFTNLKNLSTLILNNVRNHRMSLSLNNFFYLPNLKRISLRGNNLEVLPAEFLNNLPSLEEIDLSDNKIRSIPFWQTQHILRNLYLSNNKITNVDDLSLEDAKSMEILDLKNNSLSIIKIQSLRNLSDNMVLRLI